MRLSFSKFLFLTAFVASSVPPLASAQSLGIPNKIRYDFWQGRTGAVQTITGNLGGPIATLSTTLGAQFNRGTLGGPFTTAALPATCTNGTIVWDSTTATEKTCLANVWTQISGSVPDPIVPADGTQNITGALNASGSGTFGGQLTSTAAVVGTSFYDYATGTVYEIPLAATGWSSYIPNGKGWYYMDASANTLASLVDIGSTANLTVSGQGYFTGGVQVAGGTVVTFDVRFSAVKDFPLTAALSQQTLTMNTTGAATGDQCSVATTGGISGVVWCYVSAADTTTLVEVCVNGAAGTCDPVNQTYYVEIRR